MMFLATLFVLGLVNIAQSEYCYNDVVKACGAIGELLTTKFLNFN
jgi:hypothetical protein